MTIRFSTGLRNAQASGLGYQGALNKGYMHIYTGAQPASADAAHGSTLLGVISLNSATLVKETRATGSVALTTGSSGSVNTVTVGGLNIIPDVLGVGVPFNTTLTQTAADLADAINRNGIMEASASALVVTLKGRPGTGVTTAAVVTTVTTLGATTNVNMGSGVAGIAPANGLILAAPALGVISKPTTAVWSMLGAAVGTAGWFRFFSSDTNDSGGLLTAAPWYPRIDGTCGVGSGDAQLSSLAISVSSPHTVDVFTTTFPAT